MSDPLSFVVERTFHISGRGTVLLPGVSVKDFGSVQRGNPLLIRFPDGSQTIAEVSGVEYPPSIRWIGEKPADPHSGVMVNQEDVPVGSFVAISRNLSSKSSGLT